MKNLVFIVEDDLIQQKVLQLHFEALLNNYEVKTFANPEDLLTHLDEKPYAIVLDHFFEKAANTGLHYLKILRKNYPSIPVIYYTTLNDDKIRAEVMKMGAQEYIVKDSASLVRLRTTLDLLHEQKSKKGFWAKLFSK